jgi:hypothetical protein
VDALPAPDECFSSGPVCYELYIFLCSGSDHRAVAVRRPLEGESFWSDRFRLFDFFLGTKSPAVRSRLHTANPETLRMVDGRGPTIGGAVNRTGSPSVRFGIIPYGLLLAAYGAKPKCRSDMSRCSALLSQAFRRSTAPLKLKSDLLRIQNLCRGPKVLVRGL